MGGNENLEGHQHKLGEDEHMHISSIMYCSYHLVLHPLFERFGKISPPSTVAGVGTVVESSLDFFSGRLTKKERKATLADELLSDQALTQYRKRKVREIEEQNRPGGNDKWKIRGNHSRKRAKDRRN
ncbi:rRNA-processing protein fcf2 [Cucumis melo var. makuwa]|uniref:rRNA-processing protein fcf2 n=1 Tax=Cucumis melo var. makuwa TaxID=1194695 RepID=A0A5A7TEZ7_CUCMM|nr:rRNA-processing protein fcf2 [Cucumis melo var. makuwa]TYK24678.1 rRNA-processing protein fcf2 [Cucumis melo var. makuwa]